MRDLRRGEFDVLIGINLLREGLDIPEVSLVAILDADKEGFLRSERSLIQTIGRAARNVSGKVLMYADKRPSRSTRGRRDRPPPRGPARVQRGARHHAGDDRQGDLRHRRVPAGASRRRRAASGADDRREGPVRPEELQRTIVELEEEMLAAADELRFEYAARLRDEIRDVRRELER